MPDFCRGTRFLSRIPSSLTNRAFTAARWLPGTCIAGRVDIVAAMATTAVRRFFVPGSHRAAVNALFVRLDGMRDRNLVPRQKSGIAMAFCASIRQVLAGNRGVRLARGPHGMNGAMA